MIRNQKKKEKKECVKARSQGALCSRNSSCCRAHRRVIGDVVATFFYFFLLQVVITDLEDALPLLARNAARFNTSTTRTNRVVTAAAMPWGPAPLDDFRAAEGIGVRGNDPGTAQSQHGQPRFDTVIVADCLLPGSTHLFPLLASTLGALVSCPSAANPDVGAEVLFAYERRMDCTEFFALVEAAGLENAEVPIEALHPRFCAPEIHVVRMRRRRRTLNETKTRT